MHNLLLTNDQYARMSDIVEADKNVLNPSYILKSHKPISYITFILKEIYDFVNRKTLDGTLIQDLRKQRQELRKLKENMAKINSILKASLNAS